ncbi:efflux RND transporter periplasmic adaptor subunit [Sedimentitalea xiamensis]|uniref:efflux RND transporter periplasmic adaptor subunit n=1 Tax=Sedimentitalea xiamensis TaxID=3050037 RepID=UPI002541CD9A|nr:efflux RND transporter periplasmic adaptor subunit [Sedimentitalea xiamensis]
MQAFRCRFLVLLAALMAVAGCDEDSDNDDTASVDAPSVVVVEVGQREIRTSERFIGRVEAMESINLLARVDGYLEARDAIDGQSVEDGERLFVIEPAPYEAGLRQARAEVVQAEAALKLTEIELARKSELLTRGTIPQSEFDLANANRDAAEGRMQASEAAAQQAEIRLGYTEVTAPFEGRLGRIAVSEGQLVGPASGPLANLTRMSPIYVTFSLAERDLISVLQAIGDPDSGIDPDISPTVSVALPNGFALPENGRIVFVDNRVDAGTGTISLRAQFENELGLLVPGVFVNVEIGDPETSIRNTIPQASVQKDQKGDYVLVVDQDNEVEQRYVQLGDMIGADVAVRDGVAPGEIVIVEGLQRVRIGEPVEPVRPTSEEE